MASNADKDPNENPRNASKTSDTYSSVDEPPVERNETEVNPEASFTTPHSINSPPNNAPAAPSQQGLSSTTIAPKKSKDERKREREQKEREKLLRKTNQEEEDKNKIIGYTADRKWIKYKYRVGSGSFKDVHLGYDSDQAQRVAWCEYKFCKSGSSSGPTEMNKEKRQTMIKEIEYLMRLSHPNIVRLRHHTQEWVTLEDQKEVPVKGVVIITELMGCTLRSSLQKYHVAQSNGEMNLPYALFGRWWREILDALEYMHKHNLIHRDLKADNCFVYEREGDKYTHVKIGDFGLAAELTSSRQGHTIIGTIGFMAPEIFNEKYDSKVDIYAFGMVMYEVLTNKLPSSTKKPFFHGMLNALIYNIPQEIQQMRCDASLIVRACLHPLPEFRPTAEDLKWSPLFNPECNEHESTKRVLELPIAVEPNTTESQMPTGQGTLSQSSSVNGSFVLSAIDLEINKKYFLWERYLQDFVADLATRCQPVINLRLKVRDPRVLQEMELTKEEVLEFDFDIYRGEEELDNVVDELKREYSPVMEKVFALSPLSNAETSKRQADRVYSSIRSQLRFFQYLLLGMRAYEIFLEINPELRTEEGVAKVSQDAMHQFSLFSQKWDVVRETLKKEMSDYVCSIANKENTCASTTSTPDPVVPVTSKVSTEGQGSAVEGYTPGMTNSTNISRGSVIMTQSSTKISATLESSLPADAVNSSKILVVNTSVEAAIGKDNELQSLKQQVTLLEQKINTFTQQQHHQQQQQQQQQTTAPSSVIYEPGIIPNLRPAPTTQQNVPVVPPQPVGLSSTSQAGLFLQTSIPEDVSGSVRLPPAAGAVYVAPIISTNVDPNAFVTMQPHSSTMALQQSQQQNITQANIPLAISSTGNVPITTMVSQLPPASIGTTSNPVNRPGTSQVSNSPVPSMDPRRSKRTVIPPNVIPNVTTVNLPTMPTASSQGSGIVANAVGSQNVVTSNGVSSLSTLVNSLPRYHHMLRLSSLEFMCEDHTWRLMHSSGVIANVTSIIATWRDFLLGPVRATFHVEMQLNNERQSWSVAIVFNIMERDQPIIVPRILNLRDKPRVEYNLRVTMATMLEALRQGEASRLQFNTDYHFHPCPVRVGNIYAARVQILEPGNTDSSLMTSSSTYSLPQSCNDSMEAASIAKARAVISPTFCANQPGQQQYSRMESETSNMDPFFSVSSVYPSSAASTMTPGTCNLVTAAKSVGPSYTPATAAAATPSSGNVLLSRQGSVEPYWSDEQLLRDIHERINNRDHGTLVLSFNRSPIEGQEPCYRLFDIPPASLFAGIYEEDGRLKHIMKQCRNLPLLIVQDNNPELSPRFFQAPTQGAAVINPMGVIKQLDTPHIILPITDALGHTLWVNEIPLDCALNDQIPLSAKDKFLLIWEQLKKDIRKINQNVLRQTLPHTSGQSGPSSNIMMSQTIGQTSTSATPALSAQSLQGTGSPPPVLKGTSAFLFSSLGVSSRANTPVNPLPNQSTTSISQTNISDYSTTPTPTGGDPTCSPAYIEPQVDNEGLLSGLTFRHLPTSWQEAFLAGQMTLQQLTQAFYASFTGVSPSSNSASIPNFDISRQHTQHALPSYSLMQPQSVQHRGPYLPPQRPLSGTWLGGHAPELTSDSAPSLPVTMDQQYGHPSMRDPNQSMQMAYPGGYVEAYSSSPYNKAAVPSIAPQLYRLYPINTGIPLESPAQAHFQFSPPSDLSRLHNVMPMLPPEGFCDAFPSHVAPGNPGSVTIHPQQQQQQQQQQQPQAPPSQQPPSMQQQQSQQQAVVQVQSQEQPPQQAQQLQSMYNTGGVGHSLNPTGAQLHVSEQTRQDAGEIPPHQLSHVTQSQQNQSFGSISAPLSHPLAVIATGGATTPSACDESVQANISVTAGPNNDMTMNPTIMHASQFYPSEMDVAGSAMTAESYSSASLAAGYQQLLQYQNLQKQLFLQHQMLTRQHGMSPTVAAQSYPSHQNGSQSAFSPVVGSAMPAALYRPEMTASPAVHPSQLMQQQLSGSSSISSQQPPIHSHATHTPYFTPSSSHPHQTFY